MVGLRLLDVFFFAAHSALAGFVLVGWAWRRTRLVHLGVCLVTGFSWVGLGIWYGLGYCPCTDWHWRVRMALGAEDLPRSYIKYIVDGLSGLDASAVWVDGFTGGLFVLALVVSAVFNWRDWRHT